MAFYSKLNEDRALEIYKELQEKIGGEAQSMFCANNKKAGQYKGVWFELLDLWMKDKIPTFHVTDCLRLNTVFFYDLNDAIELHLAVEKMKSKIENLLARG